VVKNWLVELEILFLYLAGSVLHFLLDLFDLFVSLVDGNSLNLFGKRKVLDTLLNLSRCNLSVFLYIRGCTKKLNISTMIYYKH
jgi:hypothetical protein